MKIKTIQYSESHEIMTQMGLKRWLKMGMEAEIGEDDNPDESMLELRKQLQLLFKITEMPLPSMSTDEALLSRGMYKEFSEAKQPIPVTDYKAKDEVEIAIDNAKSIEEMPPIEKVKEFGLNDYYLTKMKGFI